MINIVLVSDRQKYLPIMYRLPKMQKVPVGCGSILASKQCQTKQGTKMVPNHLSSF